MTTMPRKGQSLPDVEFVTEEGERVSAGDLCGQRTVLYFYPKDDTPGCTREACHFRDEHSVLEKAGAVAALREAIGATDPAEAADGTVRKLYAESKGRNAIHASDSDENAAREAAFFFAEAETL